MRKLLLKGKILVFFVTLILLLSFSITALAYTTLGYKWPSASISYYVIAGTPLDYGGALGTSVGWWDSKTDVSLYNKSDGNITFSAANYGVTGWDGGTTPIHSGSTYTNAYIDINRYYTDDYDYLRRCLVIAHEFGHGLGLYHETAWTMMYYNDVYQAYLFNNDLANGPTADDIKGINDLY